MEQVEAAKETGRMVWRNVGRGAGQWKDLWALFRTVRPKRVFLQVGACGQSPEHRGVWRPARGSVSVQSPQPEGIKPFYWLHEMEMRNPSACLLRYNKPETTYEKAAGQWRALLVRTPRPRMTRGRRRGCPLKRKTQVS